MAQITASMVKQLREATAQGMMECKKALEEANGDMEQATMILRKKGLATAAKKAARETKEGLVAIRVADDNTWAARVEVVCETDFTARNEVFQAMVENVADQAAQADAGEIAASDAITAAVQDAFNKIGENMSYARGVKIASAKVGSYLHHNHKVGVVLGVDGDLDDESLTGLCMHIAFADPMAITVDEIPDDVVAQERELAKQQAIDSGKPAEIAEKMVEGKIRKFLQANALVEQPYVRDESKTVKDVLGGVNITAYARYQIG